MSQSDLCVIRPAEYGHYVEQFNNLYVEEVVNAIPDRDAWEWMQSHIPFLDCCDTKIEEIYYFRWWIYRKHIKHTPDGYVVTEFLHNHSTFCDLVITGVAGLVPRPDDILEMNPLLPEEWDYFCLDGVRYRNHLITIVWDRTGERYGEKGFQVYVDKEKRYASSSLGVC